MESYFESNKLFFPQQCNFRCGKLTDAALKIVVNTVADASNKNHFTSFLLCDNS